MTMPEPRGRLIKEFQHQVCAIVKGLPSALTSLFRRYFPILNFYHSTAIPQQQSAADLWGFGPVLAVISKGAGGGGDVENGDA